jgi:hypothetical protein
LNEKELTSELLKENVVPFKRPETKPDWEDKADDWLWKLSEGTVFAVSQPPQRDQYNRVIRNPVLLTFHVMQKLDDPDKTKRMVHLLNNLSERESFQWVIPQDFSEQFRLHKVVMKGEDLP